MSLMFMQLSEPLAVELKLALERWCRGEISPGSPQSRSRKPTHSSLDFDRSRGNSFFAPQVTRSKSLTVSSERSAPTPVPQISPQAASAQQAEVEPTASFTAANTTRKSTGISRLLSKAAFPFKQGRSAATSAPSPASSTSGGVQGNNGSSHSMRLSSWQNSLPHIAEEGGQPQTGAENSPKQRPSLRSKSASSDNLDLTGPSSPSSRRVASAGRVEARAGRALPTKDKTHVYHVVVSVARSMQKDHEVPIVVLI